MNAWPMHKREKFIAKIVPHTTQPVHVQMTLIKAAKEILAHGGRSSLGAVIEVVGDVRPHREVQSEIQAVLRVLCVEGRRYEDQASDVRALLDVAFEKLKGLS